MSSVMSVSSESSDYDVRERLLGDLRKYLKSFNYSTLFDDLGKNGSVDIVDYSNMLTACILLMEYENKEMCTDYELCREHSNLVFINDHITEGKMPSYFRLLSGYCDIHSFINKGTVVKEENQFSMYS